MNIDEVHKCEEGQICYYKRYQRLGIFEHCIFEKHCRKIAISAGNVSVD